MPIDIDEFEKKSDDTIGIDDGTNADRVLRFLAENDETAFTQSEVHDETEVKRGSVGSVLSRLEEADLVRHKGKYWAVTPEAVEAYDETDSVSTVLKML
ncbi:MAG: helix-turn-helix domain-containing protein [Halobacteriales archaeon]|nr:helix-turn-helix domain-containing protein [Halobacteriales archaeon]